MLSGLQHPTLSPLCVSIPCHRRLHPANQAYQLPAARGPPLPGSAGTAQQPVMRTAVLDRSPDRRLS